MSADRPPEPPPPDSRDAELIERARLQAGSPPHAAGPVSPSDATTQLGDPPPDLPADSFPGYTLLREIHRGGQGVVYQAIQTATGRKVAVKVLLEGANAGPAARERFRREVSLIAALDHPNIVKVVDSGIHNHLYYFAMDYIRGAPLDAHVIEAALPLEKILALFGKICDAVDYAHRRGVLHRDLKPANILVDERGEPHVVDFGIAKTSAPALSPDGRHVAVSITGQVLGSLAYMSPEQARGGDADLDSRSDVYTLGVILYQLLTRKLPYDTTGNLFKALQKITDSQPLPPARLNRRIDGDLETIVLKAMAKDPARRYQSAHDLARDLAHHLAGDPIEARRDSLIYLLHTRGRRFLRRRPLTRRLAIAAAAILIAGFLFTPLVHQWTPLNTWFERKMMSVASSSAAQYWTHVRVVRLSDASDVSELARREGLTGIDPANRPSLRRLHGRLMEKLAESGARAVVWDISFREPTEFDADLVKGVRALQARGIDTVVGVRDWSLDNEGLPAMSPAILASGVKWGSMVCSLNSQMWQVVLVRRRPGEEPMPSLALSAYVSYCHPAADFRLTFDDAASVLHLQSERRHPTVPSVRQPIGKPVSIRLTGAGADAKFDPSGLTGMTGLFLVDVPTEAQVAAMMHEYGDVLGASSRQLRDWFESRVVVIGDLRGDTDRHPHPSGKKLPGCFAHASGIDSLIRDYSIRAPNREESFFLLAAAALMGLWAGALIRRRPRTAIFLIIFLIFLWFFGSLFAYRVFAYLCNPLVPVSAMLLAAIGGAWERRSHLGEPV